MPLVSTLRWGGGALHVGLDCHHGGVSAIREPLVRPADRAFLGVCAGVGHHLGFSPWWARAATLFVPLLVPIYFFLAAAVPDERTRAVPVAQARVARMQRSLTSGRWRRLELPALLLLVALVLLVAQSSGSYYAENVAIAAVILAGLGIAWSRPAGTQATESFVRIGIGAVAVTIGVTMLALRGAVGGSMFLGVFVAVAVLGSLVLGVGPVVLHLVRDLSDERLAREREAQRADIAAHLHDSVLQTLNVIRARADHPAEVARLARAQERELRRWLYEDRPAEGTSVAEEIKQAAARAEDTYAGVVEVVTAGDAAPGSWSAPLVAALGEALANALKHGGGTASVYAELTEESVEAWVRDRGPGFSVDDLPADRAGVRESILGRMSRAGGVAQIHSPLPGGGTEVHLEVRRP